MSISEKSWKIFNKSIEDYHLLDSVDAEESNPFSEGSLEWFLYSKSWTDTVQWHLEDIIRDEAISPDDALVIKRRIDSSNQKRTDMVEYIDSYFLEKFSDVSLRKGARINTETPAWAIDRLSILALKIYHMNLEVSRKTASSEQREKCREKLDVLVQQHTDLSSAIDRLIADIEEGNVVMKTYKQMKMYNDKDLNPILYQKKYHNDQ